MKKFNIRKEVFAALMAAVTLIATAVISIPTPTLGYIHIGDAIVLTCPVLLGPWYGGLAAGLGSMLADILLGYSVSAIPTFIIKFITAFILGQLIRHFAGKSTKLPVIVAYMLIAELNMIIGYFIWSTMKLPILNLNFTKEAITAGLSNALLGLPFNIAQGVVGTILAALLYIPLGKKRLTFR